MAALRVAFAGGGTGGHIYPGLAVAEELKSLAAQKGVPLEICWIGSGRGMDRGIVAQDGTADRFYAIPCGKLRRYFSFQNFIDVFKIMAGIFASFFILIRIRPAALFSKGGFVSVPPCVAARMLGIPVLTHECDVTPGLATRINSRFAKKILVSYERTRDFLPAAQKEKAVVTGNPVRKAFYSADGARGRDFLQIAPEEKRPLLLVLGGSLGATQLNSLVTESLDWLKERFVIAHQTGRADFDKCRALADGSYKPYDFIYTEMPDLVAAADVVLSRSGASTVWESVICRKPMILVPLCGSGTRGDQLDNAKFFEEQGAAVVLAGGEADREHLASALEGLLEKEARESMSEAAAKMLPKEQSARLIASLVGEICRI